MITLPEELDEEKLSILWKPPGIGTFAVFRQAIEARGSMSGEQQLLRAVAVHPDRSKLERICEVAPNAVRDFLGDAGVYRYWGSESQIGERVTLSDDDVAALSAELDGTDFGGRLFSNTLKMPTELAGQEYTIVWRPPTHAERDQFYQTSEKRNGPRANQNLFLKVTISPGREVLTRLCVRAPIAVKDFLDEASVTRFFGVEASVSATETL